MKLLAQNLIISQYRIVSKIGAGGMGETYRERDQLTCELEAANDERKNR